MRRPLSSPLAGILTRSQAEFFVHRSRSGRVRQDPVLDLEPPKKYCAEEVEKAPVGHQSGADEGSDRLQQNTLKNKQIIARSSDSEPYKNPCCFGYRRLPLPFLSAIEETSSDTNFSNRSGCQQFILPTVPPVKVENEIEVPVSINTVPLPALKDDINESEVNLVQQTHNLDSSNVDKLCELNPSSYVYSMVVRESIGVLTGDDIESEENHVTESSNSLPEADLCLPSKLNYNLNFFGYCRHQTSLLDYEKDIPGGEEILDPRALEVAKKTEEFPIMLSVDPYLALKDDGVELVVESPNIRVTNTTKDSKKSVYGRSTPSLLDALDDVITVESPDPFLQNSIQAPMVSISEMLQLGNSSSNSITLSMEEPVGHTADSRSSVLEGKELLPVEPNLRRSGPGSHALTPRKSILKKNTRGCKGICMCLDCISFRLDAERDFEFSRRQMLEADDIVTTLTKELTCLRKITEKSTSPPVKEACRNALKVNLAAKSRIRHLISEMRIHCRLPGPRMKFIDHI